MPCGADHPPASAAKNLQSCVVRLRKALGAETIGTSTHGYALMVPADRVDAWKFEAQVARARELLTIGEADRVAFLLEQALALWRGRAFSRTGRLRGVRPSAWPCCARTPRRCTSTR